jgi:sn-glycerol 3-phosphate transport system substrate-binding protein
MISRRRILALAATLPALHTACGGRKPSGAPRAGAPPCPRGLLEGRTAPVEIIFWHSMTAANAETLRKLVDQFNAAQDRVQVRAVFQGTYTEARTKYLTALRGGGLPDIAQLEDTATQLMIDSSSVVAAQDCIDAEGYRLDDFLDRVVAYWTVAGRLWAMPFNVSAPLLFYNKTAFQRAGLDPNRPPTTLEDVRASARAIVASGSARSGIAFELSASYMEHWFAMAGEPFVNNDNGRAGRATEVRFNSDLGRGLFAWLKQMVDERLALSVGRNPSDIDHLIAIGSRDAAMTISTSASLRSVMNVLQSGQFPDVTPGVGPMPGPTGAGGVLVGGAALWTIGRSAPEKQEAARRFARWLAEPAQQAAWHAGSGYIPIRKSAAQLPAVRDLWAKEPEFKMAYDELLRGPTNVATAGPVIGAYGDVREALVKGMEQMWLRGTPADAALRQAEQEANAAIADYNRRVGK